MGFYDMMSGWGGGGWVGWSMYLGMIAVWIGVVGLVIWAVRAAVSPRPVSPRPTQATPPGTPQAPRVSALDILKRRYAAGEIDSAEYEQKRRDLT